ncbi:hypothetical protein [Chitinophaga nivalis]|uniref:Uncharacterized protein n=1 Tax=Chitinophaga nivalis TaxID=2991709 RepID=A0ABT3IFN3_9BACT|nr:hypothetical protein [Chitinophaga nivalis]MCW3467587.1 hypothetical protein [Chitinophaga nivalis]MCW3482721.1 hypothetical protein [Chitinophaga nivalis]
MKYLRPVIFLTFIAYFVMTFIFTMPDNYLYLKLYPQGKTFQFWLFQRWGFFAPPPDFDERLYYEFRDKKTQQVKVVEVLAHITEQKQKKAPFNWHEEILDYVISGNVGGVSDISSELHDNLHYQQQLKNKTGIDTAGEITIKNYIQQSSSFLTLSNYGTLVAREHGIDTATHDMRLITTRILLPRFSERNDPHPQTRKEEAVFMSDYLSFNQQK